MVMSKTGKSDLINGAINLDLNNGYVLCVSEDGERLSRKCIWGIPYEVADITEESFLQALVKQSEYNGMYQMLINKRLVPSC